LTTHHAPEKITPEQEHSMRTVSVEARRIDEPDDAAVIARSMRDPDRFAAIYERYFVEIYRYIAGRLGRDVADDLAAETFLIAFRKRDRVDPAQGGVRPWLYGIATILVGQHRRTETRRYRALARAGARLPAAAESHDDRVADVLAAERLGPDLATALAGLGQGDRDVVLLVAIADLSHQEIGLALDIPYGTVGSRLSRARGQLRAALGGLDSMLDIGGGT
jgi:RNA polymerase sigma-70 factor (ECF subfamily)